MVVLFGAAAGKFASHDQFLRTLVAIPWMSLESARVSARLVPLLEIGVAVSLMTMPRLGGTLAAGLLVAFSYVLIVEMASGRSFRCHCFGGHSMETTGPTAIVRNVVLISTAIFVAVSADRPLLPSALVGIAVGLLFLIAELATDARTASQVS